MCKNECSNSSCINSIYIYPWHTQQSKQCAMLRYMILFWQWMVDLAHSISIWTGWLTTTTTTTFVFFFITIISSHFNDNKVQTFFVTWSLFTTAKWLTEMDVFANENFTHVVKWSSFYKKIQFNKWTVVVMVLLNFSMLAVRVLDGEDLMLVFLAVWTVITLICDVSMVMRVRLQTIW